MVRCVVLVWLVHMASQQTSSDVWKHLGFSGTITITATINNKKRACLDPSTVNMLDFWQKYLIQPLNSLLFCCNYLIKIHYKIQLITLIS